jgi:hypothetical protein
MFTVDEVLWRPRKVGGWYASRGSLDLIASYAIFQEMPNLGNRFTGDVEREAIIKSQAVAYPGRALGRGTVRH